MFEFTHFLKIQNVVKIEFIYAKGADNWLYFFVRR